MNKSRMAEYWRRNLNLTVGLLIVWFVVGYLLAIVFAPQLNNITFLGELRQAFGSPKMALSMFLFYLF
ncbi:MAG: DUF4212 domain-containing protein [Deinococcales bacterium]